MKHALKFLLATVLFASTKSEAQVGIGTTTPAASSQLDITSANRGLLVPRMTSAQRIAINAPSEALLVYQTDAPTGFYFFRGGVWISLLNSVSGWSVAGNAGTVDGTNFIGTIDNTPFNIRVNNQKSGRIDQILLNTFFGYNAGNSNISGSTNTALGADALRNNSFGSLNTATGESALLNNTIGLQNTATGGRSLLLNTTGTLNTASGASALRLNISGSQNTANGFNALYNNSTGANNTGIGGAALQNNNSGSNNTALGYQSDVSTTNLTNATAIGANAIVNTSNAVQIGDGNITKVFAGTGNSTTVVMGGIQVTGGTPGSGKVLTSDASGIGTWQIAGGGGGGWSLTGNAATVDGTNFIGTIDNVPFNIRVNNQRSGRIDHVLLNSFFGYSAGITNTTGSTNTAFGADALHYNTTGSLNTATGESALLNNNIGAQNTANGGRSLLMNTTGILNTATGVSALRLNVTGSQNTATGFSALYNNSVGTNNTGLGGNALMNNTTGNNNTALGFQADVSATGLTNATAIGANAIVDASNKIRLGNASVTVIEGQVAYTLPSDGRFKINISEEDVKGLEFIKRLRPVVYNFDTKKFTEFSTRGQSSIQNANYLENDYVQSTSIRQSGFVAQEVEKAAMEVGYNFNGVHKPENPNDYYSLAYSQFVVPLVKGMQEQQQMIDSLKKQVEELKKLVNQLSNEIVK